MKLLQIIQKPQFRGAEIFACQLSEELVKLGHQVDVLFLTGSKEDSLPFELPFKYLQANLRNRFWDFAAYKRLNEIIKEGNYDLVQANAADTLKYAALSKVMFGWNSKLVYRNANKMGDFLTTLPKKVLNKFFVNQTDLIASVSGLCQQDFKLQFPKYSNGVINLPIGIKCDLEKGYQEWSQANLDLNSKEVWLHVGSFVTEKNHIGLLSIFSKYLTVNPHAVLLLIGEGKLKQNIVDHIAKENLQENVKVLGKRLDVLNLMPLCTGLLMPSHIEGLPGVILEALWSKIPVVAYNVGGISEVVKNKETGFLIPHDDEQTFVNAMQYIKENSTVELRNNAYSLVNSEYSNAIIAKKFEAEYAKIIPLKNNRN